MLVRTYLLTSFLVLPLLGVVACGEGQGAPSLSGVPLVDATLPVAGDAGVDAAPCAYGQVVCEGNTAKTCDGRGGFVLGAACKAECQDGIGCVDCLPNLSSCAAGTAKSCDTTGAQPKEITFACDGPGMTCAADGCTGPCSPGELGLTNVGCEFWPTVTANNLWSHDNQSGLTFGVLLGNTSDSAAHVDISAGAAVKSLDLLPREVKAVPLDFDIALKGPDWEIAYVPKSPTESVSKPNGAYRVRSNRPLVAYQFNGLAPEAPAKGALGACPGLPSAQGASVAATRTPATRRSCCRPTRSRTRTPSRAGTPGTPILRCPARPR